MSDNQVLKYLKRYRLRYFLGFLALVGASLVVMLPPVVVRDAVDAIGKGTTRGQLATYGGYIMALALLESILRFAARHLVSGTSRYVEYDLRTDLATRFMALDQRFYTESQTGDLMARCTNDLQVIRDLMGPTLIDILRIITMVAIGFGFLLTIDTRLALIAIAYFPIIGFVVVYFRVGVEAKFRAVQDQFGLIATRVQENMSGMRTIKAYAQEDSETATFIEANREMKRRSMSWAYYTSAMWPLMAVLTGASTILVLWFGGHDVVEGRITTGQFVQFNTYLAVLANPIMSLGWTVTALQQGAAAMKRVSEILSSVPRIRDPEHPTHLDHVRGEIEFRDVTFGYRDRPVLEDISLRIPAGSTVALVGSTGVGKTTLVNLIARLYDPWKGQVLLDGVDVRDLSLEQLREAIGFVPQETFLFSDSLRDNIAYGRAEPSPEELQYALETSQLVNDLPQLTHGIETVIGERGLTLSGGQKQRTALARALLKRPPVVILDDALSHVDTHTEEEILKRLKGFMEERTTIIIAHRTSTLASADMIVALEDGRIAEVGTHDELLRLNGVYARFYRRQQLAEQLAEDEAVTPAEVEQGGPGVGAPS
ncbi:MAG TPA: ABC transporter ATP-binding protein [Dehalococcoidia bacterium]|nr:ABC transporter ATP-binding protein [Dehalococcoidia bacterium]